jgi:hypothetical protein
VQPQPRRRWAFFPRSILSEYDNPAAHLYRAMARSVHALDDEARFYEERANPWLRSMLLAEGARAFRTFQERHPEVTYVTYEPRTGHRLAEWLSLALATVDIVVVDADAPETIVQWIGELTRPQLHTFLLDPDGRLGAERVIPEFASEYRAICVSRPEVVPDVFASVQRLITFGPATSAPGGNGNADRHIDETANELISHVIQTVEETLAHRASDSTPDTSG